MNCLGLGYKDWKLKVFDALIVGGFCALIVTVLAVAYCIGLSKGEDNCIRERVRLDTQYIKAKHMTNQATVIFFKEQELKKSCFNIVKQEGRRKGCYACHTEFVEKVN